MEEEIGCNEGEVSKNGFIMLNNNFLNYWSGIIGPGPSVLYMDLLSYCYGKKTHAWPSVKTLAKECIREDCRMEIIRPMFTR